MRLRLKLHEAQGIYKAYKPKEDEAAATLKRRERTLLNLRRAIRSPVFRAAYIKEREEKHTHLGDPLLRGRKAKKRKEVDVSSLPPGSGGVEVESVPTATAS
jgi:hypothetical protein